MSIERTRMLSLIIRVLDLLDTSAETLITTGEKSWLEAHAVPAEFWSRVKPW